MLKLKGLTDNINHFVDTLFESKWILFFIFAITSIIVFISIGRESLWLDEIFSATTATKTASLSVMFHEYIFFDVHPPLYSILLYSWASLFGNSDTTLRLLSYAFVLLSFIISFRLLSSEYHRRVAVIFIALSAFTPIVLLYAQEVRSYTLLYLLSSIVTILFSIFINRIRQQQQIKKSHLILFGIAGAMLCLTHYFGYVVICSLAITALFFSISQHQNQTAKQLFIYSSFIAIIGIIWLGIHFYFGDIAKNTGGNFWVQNDILGTLEGFFYLVFGRNRRIILILSALLILALTISIIQLKSSFFKYTPIILAAFVTIGIAHLISLHTPILDARNLIVIVPAILLFLAMLFDASFENSKFIVLSYMFFLIISTTIESHRYTKQNWKEATQYVDTNFGSNQCKVPIEIPDPSSGLNFSMYPAYYSKQNFEYLPIGPKLQKNCDLIYFQGQISEEYLANLLIQYNISQPYKILDFKGVFIVVKDN